MIEVFGVPFSAHTRKVLVALREKSIAYQLLPAIPLDPPLGFAELSPLNKIPVLRTSELTIADSSVICQYVERIHPSPALYPTDPAEFARALWFEEFVDGGLAPHVLRGLLAERAMAPRFFHRAPDEALIRRSLEHELPPKFAYLEANVRGDSLVGEHFTIADITVGSMMINYHYAGETLSSFPKLQRYVEKLLRRACFQRALTVELAAAEQFGGLDLTLVRRALQ